MWHGAQLSERSDPEIHKHVAGTLGSQQQQLTGFVVAVVVVFVVVAAVDDDDNITIVFLRCKMDASTTVPDFKVPGGFSPGTHHVRTEGIWSPPNNRTVWW